MQYFRKQIVYSINYSQKNQNNEKNRFISNRLLCHDFLQL